TASRLREIVTAHGAESVLPYSYAGTMGALGYASMDRRFFYRLGASLLDRTICSTAGKVGYDYTIGAMIGTDPEEFANARLIVLDGLHDADYVARYTLGFDELRERVADCPPEWAEAHTGVPAATIERLAREYATTQPAAIRVNYGMQRHANGGMAIRTVACLP